MKQLGKAPTGERLEKIKRSFHSDKGRFKNLSPTRQFTEGYNLGKIAYQQIVKSFPDTTPPNALPNIKTNINTLDKEEDILLWFGHSSYYFQLRGKSFLVDPVFSGNASPIPRTNTSFDGSDIYSPDDFEQIDYLIITHDHYDHLDYPTIIKLRDKVKHVVCGLGVGAHLEYWGYDPAIITEGDWWDEVELQSNLRITYLPARHFSGRSFARNNTLWTAYLLETSDYKLFIGGDSGYDTHFTKIGEKFDSIDLAIMENGQYNKAWKYIHAAPKEAFQAANELRAKRALPMHSCKFKLSSHPWYEPLEVFTSCTSDRSMDVLTPMIGQPVYLRDEGQQFEKWWRKV